MRNCASFIVSPGATHKNRGTAFSLSPSLWLTSSTSSACVRARLVYAQAILSFSCAAPGAPKAPQRGMASRKWEERGRRRGTSGRARRRPEEQRLPRGTGDVALLRSGTPSAPPYDAAREPRREGSVYNTRTAARGTEGRTRRGKSIAIVTTVAAIADGSHRTGAARAGAQSRSPTWGTTRGAATTAGTAATTGGNRATSRRGGTTVPGESTSRGPGGCASSRMRTGTRPRWVSTRHGGMDRGVPASSRRRPPSPARSSRR
jgi:hypothetical protein